MHTAASNAWAVVTAKAVLPADERTVYEEDKCMRGESKPTESIDPTGLWRLVFWLVFVLGTLRGRVEFGTARVKGKRQVNLL
jgi:hypothetical protein